MNTFVYFTNHSIESRGPVDETISADLRLMTRRVFRNLVPLEKQGDLISTDDRPLTEWLTNRIVLEAFGVI